MGYYRTQSDTKFKSLTVGGIAIVRTILFSIAGGFGGLMGGGLVVLLAMVVLLKASPVFEVPSPRLDYIILGLVGLSVFSGSIVGLLLARRNPKSGATLKKSNEHA